ncbi:MAG: hypothetical protein ACKKL4_01540 [Patescibacteria group bacterium]
MKYYFFIIICTLPIYTYAQVGRIVAPTIPSDVDIIINTDIDSQRSYFDVITVSTSTPSDTVNTKNIDSKELDIEGMKSAILSTSTATSSDIEVSVETNQTLSSAVSQINKRYEEAQARCSTGSWFENIWCRIKWW